MCLWRDSRAIFVHMRIINQEPVPIMGVAKENMSTTEGGSTDTNSDSEKKSMPTGESRPMNGEKEEEKTLTDHLNKKLLQSFLERMDAGTAAIPPLPDSTQDQDEERQDFED